MKNEALKKAILKQNKNKVAGYGTPLYKGIIRLQEQEKNKSAKT